MRTKEGHKEAEITEYYKDSRLKTIDHIISPLILKQGIKKLGGDLQTTSSKKDEKKSTLKKPNPKERNALKGKKASTARDSVSILRSRKRSERIK